jgi:hypothetical protein
MLGVEGLEPEIFEAPTTVVGHESQEEDQGISVTADGMQTHAAQLRQILAEEFLQVQA